MKTFVIPFLIAVLSGMGLGGGGLLVIYLTLIEGTAQMVAQGANLSFFIVSAAASTLFSLKQKKIVWRTSLLMSVFGIIGSLLGTVLAGAVSPELLKKVFGGMLVITGIIGVFKK